MELLIKGGARSKSSMRGHSSHTRSTAMNESLEIPQIRTSASRYIN